MNLVSLFLRPHGRIAPPTFWAGFGVLSVISVACLFVPRAGGFLWLATFFPWIMLNAKRLHDMGLSGWVQLVQHLVNIGIVILGFLLLGGAVFLTLFKGDMDASLNAGAAAGASAGFLLTGGIVAFNTLWLIWLGGSPGTPDENRFGRPTNWP